MRGHGARRAIHARLCSTAARLALSACAVALLGTCALWRELPGAHVSGPASTFERLLARAQAGDAESQNAVGYMLYHGEGVPRDAERAREWFTRAAQQGNARAQRNLAGMAAGGALAAPRLPARGRDVGRGEELYLAFCSGCHGVNGISAYEHSPSFAFGERLDKGDALLLRSLLQGNQEMPGWDGKLTRSELLEVFAYLRTLAERYDRGVTAQLREAPEVYYLFGPMEQRAWGARPAPR